MIWIFIVDYNNRRFDYYILTKQEDQYKSIGVIASYENSVKIVSIISIIEFILCHWFYVVSFSRRPIKDIIESRDIVEFMYDNKILIRGFEKIIYYKEIEYKSSEIMKKVNLIMEKKEREISEEFTRD